MNKRYRINDRGRTRVTGKERKIRKKLYEKGRKRNREIEKKINKPEKGVNI